MFIKHSNNKSKRIEDSSSKKELTIKIYKK